MEEHSGLQEDSRCDSEESRPEEESGPEEKSGPEEESRPEEKKSRPTEESRPEADINSAGLDGCRDEAGQGSSKATSSSTSQKKLTDNKRLAVYQCLLEQCDDGTLRRGSISVAAQKFSVSTDTISRIWHRGQESIADGAATPNVSSKMKGRVGRKKKDLQLSRVADVPPNRRKNIRSLALAINVSKSTLHRRMKEVPVAALESPATNWAEETSPSRSNLSTGFNKTTRNK